MFADNPVSKAVSQTNNPSSSLIGNAVRAFQSGKPVLVHDFDDRESEVDLIYPALSVTPSAVARLRNDAGGLICVALSHEVAEAFNLPYLSEEIDHVSTTSDHLGYDERSSFSLTVNHRNTYTGITDIDRALTITSLGRASGAPETVAFEDEFRCPGHVHLLKAAPGLLTERKGHTELGLVLAREAGRASAVVVCEMLDDETGRSLTKQNAQRYARRYHLPYLEGKTIVREFQSR